MSANFLLYLFSISTLIPPICLVDTITLHPSILKIFNAFVKILNFYGENYHDINMDGIFGLRVLEGHLKELVMLHRSMGHSSNIPNDIIGQLLVMSDEAGQIANLSIPYLIKTSESYFQAMGKLVTRPWTVFKNYRNINDDYKWGTVDTWPDYGERIDWGKSDICLEKILSLNEADNDVCSHIDNTCLEMFMKQNVHAYSLTHQVFYLMITEQFGCTSVIENYLKVQGRAAYKLEDIETEICTNCYYDLKSIEDPMRLTLELQILFLQNKFYCGSLGFVEFMNDEWLDLVLNWQRASGCFSNSWKEDNLLQQKDHLSRKKDDYLRPNKPLPLAPQQQQQQQNVVQQQVPQQEVVQQQLSQKNNVQGQNPRRKTKKLKSNLQQDNQNSVIKNENENNINNKNKLDDSDYENYQQRRRREAIINSIDDYKIESNPIRKLLEEREVTGGCLSHKTAMAVGTLTMYLRYLIDPPSKYIHGNGRQSNDYLKPDNIAAILPKPKYEDSKESKTKMPSPVVDADKTEHIPETNIKLPETPKESKIEIFSSSSLADTLLIKNSFIKNLHTQTIIIVVAIVSIIILFVVIKCMRRRSFGARGKSY